MVSGGSDKTTGDVPTVETEQQVAGEQTAEKVAPLFSQPATTIMIDTEACTHEVLYSMIVCQIWNSGRTMY